MKALRLLMVLALALPEAASSRSLLADHSPPDSASTRRAPIALLVDLSSGQTLFSREAEVRFLPASMAKAMSALVAFDLIKAGRLGEDTLITVRPETAARWTGKGTSLRLAALERVRVDDLLLGLTTVSANDAAIALAEGALGSTEAWVAAMNARAKALGMDDSHFGTPNGFPDHGATYVTARDMVRLARALITEHPDLYRRYFGKAAMHWHGSMLASHDPFAGVLPGADGIKTGHTYEAGFNFLGAAVRGGQRLVVVIGRAPTEPDRANAAKALVEWGYEAWNSQPFLSPGWIIGTIKVQGGAQREVPVTVPRPFSITLPSGPRPKVSARIVYQGPVRAPIAAGAVIAGLEVTIAGQPVYFLPLVAARPVNPAGPIDRIMNGLLGLLS